MPIQLFETKMLWFPVKAASHMVDPGSSRRLMLIAIATSWLAQPKSFNYLNLFDNIV